MLECLYIDAEEKMNTVDKFDLWMENEQYSEVTRSNYIKALGSLPSKLNLNIEKPLLEVVNAEEFQRISESIMSSTEFEEINTSGHHVYSAAIGAYQKYLNSDVKFSWLPFFKEMLDKIISAYNKETLCQLYREIQDGTKYPLNQIDPFTFILSIQGLKKLQQIKEKMGLSIDIKDLNGIPRIDTRGPLWLLDEEHDKFIDKHIDRLWVIAKELCEHEEIDRDNIQYLLEIKGVSATKLSTIMFKCYPNKFFPLDQKTLDYSKQKLLGEDSKSADKFIEMQEVLKNQFPDKKPYQVSYEAWRQSKKGDIEIDTMNNNVSQNTLVQDLKELLGKAKNIILHGAPGTGKTYLAHQIAEAMAAEQKFVQFHPSYDYTDFVEGLRPADENTENGQIGFKRIDGTFKEFCAQALGNLEESAKNEKTLRKEEEIKDAIKSFVEQSIEEEKEFNTLSNRFSIIGITDIHIIVSVPDNNKTKEYRLPINNLCKMFLWDDQNNLQRKDLKNIFNHKYSNALDSYLFAIYEQMKNMNIVPAKKNQPTIVEEKAHVFIIDEINRGDLSKIFGELFFAIDPGYRGKKEKRIQTQYQNLVDEDDVFSDGFYVPDNVYIIGTMNDIDRSVESMDFAFRRRFTFVEITADKTAASILESLEQTEREKCKEIMDALNAKISEISGLGSPTDYHIGGAYFLKLKDLNYDYKKFWEYHLKGLLKEYFRGMEDSGKLLADLEKEYNELI